MKKVLPVLLSLICVALLSPWVRAQEIPNAGASVAASGDDSPPVPESGAPASGRHAGGSDTSSGYWSSWFKRVIHSQAEQPHWITPLATVTPRLEQEFRYDVAWQRSPAGTVTENYGFSKGLELIPSERVEAILGLPPYIVHNQTGVRNGYGDVSFLLKYRVLSKNEQKGNYILTFFFAASAPTGQFSNGARDAIITPTLAAGKGWGKFDIQSTIGGSLPTGDTNIIGRAILWNTAFQYHLLRKLWPEVEVNSTFFADGPRTGKKQTFLTPGLVAGRIPLWRRLGLSIGTGVQIATTHFHTSNHNWILSVRFPF